MPEFSFFLSDSHQSELQCRADLRSMIAAVLCPAAFFNLKGILSGDLNVMFQNKRNRSYGSLLTCQRLRLLLLIQNVL